VARVLIVDNDPSLHLLVEHILTHSNYETASVHNAYDALEYLMVQGADGVIIDLQMPQMQGVQLIEEILHNFPGIPMVALGVHSKLDMPFNGLLENVPNYLLKPFKSNQLLEMVSRAIPQVR
jgi:DNA-binding NtrC family response regulator